MSNLTVLDPSWLDLENMTPDRWRSLIYNRIVQHRNVFVVEFRNKVVNEINECLVNRKSDESLEKLHCDLLNKINKEQFELEYHRFVDGIVTATFEYVCQFIIKNSLDNIKHTQRALGLLNFTNDGVNKDNYKSPRELELSKQTLILCSSESNNNTTDLNKVILSHIFNNSSQNELNCSEILEKETDDNTSINKKDEIYFLNDKHAQIISNQEHPVELETTDELNIGNNYMDAQTRSNQDLPIELEMTDQLNIRNSYIDVQTRNNLDFPVELETTDELNLRNNCMDVQIRNNQDLPIELETTDELNKKNNDTAHPSVEVLDSLDVNDKEEDEALISLVFKISQKDLNFNSSDDFENENIPDESIGAEFPTSSSLVFKNELNPFAEDEYQINNSLRILENLVNIEHDKLEVQKRFPVKQEFQQSSNEKKQSEISDTINITKNKNRKSKEKVIVKSVEKDLLGSMKRKIKQLVGENKPKKMKKHEVKTSKKSVNFTKIQNDMNNLSLGDSSSNTAIQTDYNNLLTENSTAHSIMLKLSETVTNNTQIIETPVQCPLEHLSAKNNILSKELQVQQYTENCTLKVKEYTLFANNSNVLPLMTYPTPSTSNYKDKNMENSFTKSSSCLGSTMKTVDYKKLYEKDCKSLFNPDLIIRSSLPKDSIFNHSQKKENNLLKVKDNYALDKNRKPPPSFKIQLKNLSDKKKMSRKKIRYEQKLKKLNTSYNAKLITDDTTNSVGQTFSSTIAENGHIKFKRLKTEKDIDVSKINAGINENISRITESPENIITTENLDMNVNNTLPNTDILEYNVLPDWLKTKWIFHKIKSSYVVINKHP